MLTLFLSPIQPSITTQLNQPQTKEHENYISPFFADNNAK